MINKKLIHMVPESRKYIIANILFSWLALLGNIAFLWYLTAFIEKLYYKQVHVGDFQKMAISVLVIAIVRCVCTIASGKMGYMASKDVKTVLREQIYRKLLRLGASYSEHIETSEVVQLAVEGAEQLQTYFGSYLPQFFYSMLAPVTLFVFIASINVPAAVILIVCVPLIPLSIMAVQKWAKKLLGKYWSRYTELGDSFLENLQGLTTLKIYQTDGEKNIEMNAEAEVFRKITMKVLTMQLNSIILMDVIAYGGAGLGIIVSVSQLMKGSVTFSQALLIILLSAEFFIPMRLLGSFFHIAMNGMAAWEKIETFLSVEEPSRENKVILTEEDMTDIRMKDVCFSYTQDREILDHISFQCQKGAFVAIVGESGSGKSTIASLLRGKKRDYKGQIKVGELSHSAIQEESLMQNITTVTHDSYLFRGTVRDNLLMGNAEATDSMMHDALARVRLDAFITSVGGLDYMLLEKGANLSGGQCQRLSMARALLHDSPVYIFDEATSNIDVESENAIVKEIERLAKEKTVLMISHRLANTVEADRIFVIDKGKIVEEGSHSVLLKKEGCYRKIWDAQQRLENVGREI